MKIRYEELKEKRNTLIHLISNEENSGMSKLKYAILKWDKEASKQLANVQKEYASEFAEKKEYIEIFNAIEKDGILLKKDNEYQYSKENYLTLSKEISKLKNEIENKLSQHEIEFEPYLLTDQETIDKLDIFLQEELKGIFI